MIQTVSVSADSRSKDTDVKAFTKIIHAFFLKTGFKILKHHNNIFAVNVG